MINDKGTAVMLWLREAVGGGLCRFIWMGILGEVGSYSKKHRNPIKHFTINHSMIRPQALCLIQFIQVGSAGRAEPL